MENQASSRAEIRRSPHFLHLGDRRRILRAGRFPACVLLAGVLCAPIHAEEPAVVFEEPFERELHEDWTWIREDPAAWRIFDNGLEIRLDPGDAQTVKNALVRPAPDRSEGTFAVELTVTNLEEPVQQWEQAGITWYQNGEPVFKLVKELVDGNRVIVPGFKSVDHETVQLRLIVTADRWTAAFRPNAEGEFQTAATGDLPPPGNDEVSIQGYHGPPDAEHWIRFTDFRILKLD